MAAISILSPAQYAIERAICDKAESYRQAHATFSRGGWSSMSAELAAHPDYAACDNAMRGRVEQYELLTDTPERLSAYIGKPNRNGMGVDRIEGQTYPVTVWTGDPIGFATSPRRVTRRTMDGPKYMFYARINGREFQGEGHGEGMFINLRETAASKRARAAKSN